MARHVAVVGLGYVGLSLGALLASRGFHVDGVEIDPAKVDAINAGRVPFGGEEPGLGALLQRVVKAKGLHAHSSFEPVQKAAAVFICVDTPIDPERRPRMESLRGAAAEVGRRLRPKALVVVESTIAPGTMRGIVQPALEEASGLRAGRDFLLAHCPERVMPGRLLKNLQRCERVIGGLDRASTRAAMTYYRRLTRAKLHPTDMTTAEVVKTAENAYRDVQIAFANEVALLCEPMSVDTYEVRRLVNTAPFRDMHVPGAGVGGHCLPKDPWLLVFGSAGAHPKLIPAARSVNDGMPYHVLTLLASALAEANVPLSAAKVALLGVSFLPGSADTRNSPAHPIYQALLGQVAEIRLHDPYARELNGISVLSDLSAALSGADAAVFLTSHSAYTRLDLRRLRRLLAHPVLVDGRGLLSRDRARAAGFVYRGVGR